VLDLAVKVGYLVATVVFGAWVSRAQLDVKDCFVSGRTVPWWAVMGSIATLGAGVLAEPVLRTREKGRSTHHG
jgi:Na+/proline symporter